jgi:hypothetical protein
MQRIDENTYIDDTLVTCAEYQLFIDEMREQGKYYQPDHWTSYQFPPGQSREPILGVRYSDVEAFCDWLTQQESEKWNYQLPTQKEASSHPIIHHNQVPLGYWVKSANNGPQFVWIDPIPTNARRIDKSSIPPYSTLDMPYDLPVTFMDGINSALASALIRPLDLVLACAFRAGWAQSVDLVLNTILDRAPNIGEDFDHASSKSGYLEEAGDLAFYVEAQQMGSGFRSELDLYFDIFTLHERIAGRSPAFEGIRLVKERIK